MRNIQCGYFLMFPRIICLIFRPLSTQPGAQNPFLRWEQILLPPAIGVSWEPLPAEMIFNVTMEPKPQCEPSILYIPSFMCNRSERFNLWSREICTHTWEGIKLKSLWMRVLYRKLISPGLQYIEYNSVHWIIWLGRTLTYRLCWLQSCKVIILLLSKHSTHT
jgi:hypothetical protein